MNQMWANSETTKPELDLKQRVMLIIWAAFLFTILVYFVMSLFIPAPVERPETRIISLGLMMVGTVLVVASLAVGRQCLNRSEQQQSPVLLQKGLILCLALCEVAALLGLVDHLVTGSSYYFLLILIGFVGILFHFPRRKNLLAATYRLRNAKQE